jgi:hypothetical protein
MLKVLCRQVCSLLRVFRKVNITFNSAPEKEEKDEIVASYGKYNNPIRR